MSEKRDHAAPLIAVPFSGAAGPGKRPPTPQRAAGDPVSDRLNALSERLNAPPGAFTPPKAILLCPLTPNQNLTFLGMFCGRAIWYDEGV